MISAKPQWSANTTEYFMLWVNNLHNNSSICKNTICECYRSAFDLAIIRLENIANGMPDLSAKEDQAIWTLAFELHEKDCHQKDKRGWRIGIISPLWARPVSPSNCNCFERTRVNYLWNKPEQKEIPNPNQEVSKQSIIELSEIIQELQEIEERHV